MVGLGNLWWGGNSGWQLATPVRPTMWLGSWSFEPHVVSPTSGEGKGAGDWAMWAMTQACLCNQTPVTTLDTEAWVSFSGWQYSICCHIQIFREGKASWVIGERTTEASKSGTLPVLALCIHSFGWFVSLHYNKTLTITRVLSWVLWVALVNHWAWGGNRNSKFVAIRSEVRIAHRPSSCSWSKVKAASRRLWPLLVKCGLSLGCWCQVIAMAHLLFYYSILQKWYDVKNSWRNFRCLGQRQCKVGISVGKAQSVIPESDWSKEGNLGGRMT